MPDLIDQQGIGWQTPTGHTRAGQWYAYGGGGMLRVLDPGTSDNEQLEEIQHRGYVPWFLAALDDATLECPISYDSIGLPRQPVAGGLSAPSGLHPPFQYSAQLIDGNESVGQIDAVSPPRTTRAAW